MMDAEMLYNLLPAIYRVRDAEQGGALQALMSVLAEQATALEENLAQLYDDQFIETAADWVVPYIGDLIGYRALYGVTPELTSPRAEVANTIAYRRRKGTAAMLEQLARDVTGWDVRAVEFFERLATTQYMNHIRPDNLYAPDLRRWEPLERIGTAFDSVAHTADVRHTNRRRGKYNISNVGIFLWRLGACPLTRSPAFAVNATRYTFSPLGNAAPLFTDPMTEDAITHLAEPLNVPLPISRRVLHEQLGSYYGAGKSLFIELAARDAGGKLDPAVKSQPVPASQIIVCDLSDVTDTGGTVTGWAHMSPPAGKVAVDPVLGRLAFPADPKKIVLVSYHYGFSADMGGGEYERAATFDAEPKPATPIQIDAELKPVTPIQMPGQITAALAGEGVVEIQDSGRYAETPVINVATGKRVELRAANGARPTLALGGEFAINGGADAEVTLNGLLIAGGTLRVTGQLRRLRLTHCTLVPGLALDGAGKPLGPAAPSLVVESAGTLVVIDHCILGGLRVADGASVTISDSIVDSTAEDAVAYAGLPDPGATKLPPPGGDLTVANSTIVGKIRTRQMPLASNVIFLARLAAADAWKFPVHVDQRQAGCVRFSFLPVGSRTPRRHNCQPAIPEEATRVRPQFTSLHYGDPGYGHLSARCAAEIRAGADDESEMGAFHDLYQPQRETNLRVRLDEYLRFGLEAGIFYAS
jgi:hypothetical protein